MKMLLEHEADPYVANYNGKTALMIAQSRGHNDVVQALTSKGKFSRE